jgi:hypothetical protein
MNIISGVLIASMLLLQGIGGKASKGGKGGFGGSVPTPPPAFAGNCAQAVNSVLTINCTISGVAAGDFIAIGFLWYNTNTPSVISDSAGTLVPALASHPVVWDAGTRSVDMYYEANASAGTHTLTIAFASTLTLIAMAAESFHGASISTGGAALDGTPTSNVIALNTNPFSCNPITTTQTNSTIFAWGGVTLSTTSAGTGYTTRNTINTNYTSQDGPATLPGSYSAVFNTTGTNHPAMCLAMAIKHV